MYPYKLTSDAQRELDNELAYSVEMWGRRHAQAYAKALQQKILLICANPFMHTERSDILPGIRLCQYKGSRIVYTIGHF